MRPHTFLLALASLAALAGPVRADSVSGTRSTKLVERAHAISVTIGHGWARLTVQRTFENGGEKHDQAMVHIDEMPLGAVAIGLRTQGTKGEWYEGELLEAELAAKRYRELTGIGGYYPKDPALLSWRSVNHLALQVFPIDPKGGKKTVEYTLLVPTSYEHGHDVLHLPAMGATGTRASFTAKADLKGDRLELAGLPLAGTHVLSAPHTVELIRADPGPALGGTFASVPFAKRALVHTRVEVSGVLSTVPKNAHIVVVLDASRSVPDDLLRAEVAAARGYLSHFPDAKVQVLTFARKVTPMHATWVSGTTAMSDLASVKLPRANGSELDVAFADAAKRLDGAPAGTPRRVLLMSALRLRSTLTPEALGTFDPSHGLLHLAHVRRVAPSMERNDDGIWAKLPRASGGLMWEAHVSGEAADEKSLRKVTEEWARPLRIDRLVADGVGLSKQLGVPSTLAEGEGYETTLVQSFATPGIELRGELWSKPMKTVLTTSPDEEKRWAALSFGESLGLTDPEMMVLAMKGHAVSPVTSLLAIEPGVRPSTEGLEWDSFGAGGLGLSGIGIGGGGKMVSGTYFDPQKWLRTAGATAFTTCGAKGRKGAFDLQSTRDEIVAVRARVEGTSAEDPMSTCIAERLWEVELPSEFTAEWAAWHVTIGE